MREERHQLEPFRGPVDLLGPGASAALEYLVLWRLNEAVRPGWARRYQNRAANETGQRFWLSPTSAVQ